MPVANNNIINSDWEEWNQFTRELKRRIEQSEKNFSLVKLRDGRIMEVTYTPENSDYSEMFMCVDENCHLCWSLSGRNYTSEDFDILEFYETADIDSGRGKTFNQFQIEWLNQSWEIWKDGEFRASGSVKNSEISIHENKGIKEELIFLLIEEIFYAGKY